MNVLPLVMALLLMLSVLTIEKMEKFKHQQTVQIKYQDFLTHEARKVYNQRQKSLARVTAKNIRQLSFRSFVDKGMREKNEEMFAQTQLLTGELIKIVYGHTTFYKELEQKRPQFVQEMLVAIQQAAEQVPEKGLKRIKDIIRLQLQDEELQKAFYQMLKGTGERKIEEVNDPEKNSKCYPSLLNFINYEKSFKIEVQHAPTELLKAIFESDEVVNSILKMRNELAKTKDTTTFTREFSEKRRVGINSAVLDFKITGSDKTGYD